MRHAQSTRAGNRHSALLAPQTLCGGLRLVTVLLGMKLCCFAGMVRGVLLMSMRRMGVMCRPFVIAFFVILRCFAVMLGRGVVVLGGLVMMLGGLSGHFSSFDSKPSFQSLWGAGCTILAFGYRRITNP